MAFIKVEATPQLRKHINAIFTDEFMQANTSFDNFEGFQYSSAVITNWKSDRMVYAKLLMDGFVRESTRFSSWDEMVKTAADERFGKP